MYPHTWKESCFLLKILCLPIMTQHAYFSSKCFPIFLLYNWQIITGSFSWATFRVNIFKIIFIYCDMEMFNTQSNPIYWMNVLACIYSMHITYNTMVKTYRNNANNLMLDKCLLSRNKASLFVMIWIFEIIKCLSNDREKMHRLNQPENKWTNIFQCSALVDCVFDVKGFTGKINSYHNNCPWTRNKLSPFQLQSQ